MMMLLNVKIVWYAIAACLTTAGLLVAVDRIRHPAVRGRHHAPAPPADPPRGAPGYTTGSMWWPEEQAYLVRRDGIIHIDRNGDVDLTPWEVPHGAEAGAMWPKHELWNGHTIGCLRPDEDHPGACPEEGDDPDDPYGWPLRPLPEVNGL